MSLGSWPMIQLCYNAVCFAVYGVFVVVMMLDGCRKNATFSSSFFLICINLAVVDILSAGNKLLISLRMWNFWPSTFEYFEKNFALERLVNFFAWYFPYTQVSALEVLTINRLTAVVFPTKHEKLWHNGLVTKALVANWIVPLLLTAPLLEVSRGVWVPVDNTSADTFNIILFDYPDAMGFYYMLDAVIYSAVVISQLVMYGLMLRAYRVRKAKKPQKITNVTTQTVMNKLEVKITIFGFSMSLMMTLIALYSLTAAYVFVGGSVSSSFEELLFVYIYSISYDAMTFANPFLMLLCSSEIRRKFLRLLRCRSVDAVTHIQPQPRSFNRPKVQ